MSDPLPICPNGQQLEHNNGEMVYLKPDINLLALLADSKRVLLIGDIIIDTYIYGKCSRVADDAPIPIFEEATTEHSLGGAGNVANNLNALGLSTDFLTVVGENDETCTQLLQERNVNTDDLIKCPGYSVRVIERYFQGQHQCFRVNKNTKYNFSADTKDFFIARYLALLQSRSYNVIVISDYHNGLLCKEVVQKIITTAQEFNTPTLIDPKFGEYERFTGATYLKPSPEDVAYYLKIKTDTNKNIKTACIEFSQRLKVQTIFLTLSENGIAFYDTDKSDVTFGIIPCDNKGRVVNVCGAGDTVLASIAFSISHGLNMEQTCYWANRCAANVIERIGTVSVSMLQIITDKIVNTKKELETLKSIIPKGKTVAATTGCFDLLHVGHLRSLQQAKEQADLVIVALNSDISVQILKGESRPIIPLEQRAEMLASLSYVDFIVVFDERCPTWIMDTLDPDVLVKGNDYTYERLKNSYPFIQKIHITDSRISSTTEIIEKVKKCE